MIIAVDTGGTKTLIVSFDTAGVKQQIARFPTPKNISEYIEAVATAIESNVDDMSTIDIITLVLPGPIRDGVLLHAENLGWQQADVLTQLQTRLADLNIVVGNDADVAGLGEMRSMESPPSVGMYITFSTGIGAGLCFDGKLPDAMDVFEVGKMRLEFDGKLQRWEEFASGQNFYERYGQYGSDVDDPDKWRDYAHRMAVGLLCLIPMLEPEVIAVGGSMGTHFAKYQAFLDEILNESIPAYMANTSIVQSNHPEEAVVDGCYYFALDAMAS